MTERAPSSGKKGLLQWMSGAKEVAKQAKQAAQHYLPQGPSSSKQPQQQRQAHRQRQVPRNLNLTYITDQLLVAPRPADAPNATFSDRGRDPDKPASRSTSSSTPPQPQHEQQQQQEKQQPQGSQSNAQGPPSGTNPGRLLEFLETHHGSRNLLTFSLSDQTADDRTLLLFRRQIVHVGWKSPCPARTETPTLAHLLHVCQALHAYLSLSDHRVALITCDNGRTRSALVAACYLKYAHHARTSWEAFLWCCTCMGIPGVQNSTSPPEGLVPPSILTLFRNFDATVERNDYGNPKPLLLRAIALQGVPVDDKPCIDIWDGTGQHVYSSHSQDKAVDNHMESDENDETDQQPKQSQRAPLQQSSQWADEEGFYRANIILRGDFLLVCRFGGAYAAGTGADASLVLFRYAHNTAFLSSGSYEIPKQKVDMMRRYATSFDGEDFLLTLLLESYWDVDKMNPSREDNFLREELQRNVDPHILPPLANQTPRQALQRGWHTIAQHHMAKPDAQDSDRLRSLWSDALHDCPLFLLQLALQLNNLDVNQAAKDLLLSSRGGASPLRILWTEEKEEEEDISCRTMDSNVTDTTVATRQQPRIDEGCLDVLRILDRAEGKPEQDYSAYSQTKVSRESRQDEKESTWIYQPMMFPNRGDVVDGFGYDSTGLDGSDRNRRIRPRRPLVMGSRPLIPMHGQKRRRHLDPTTAAAMGVIESSRSRKRRLAPLSDSLEINSMYTNPHGVNGDLVYDDDFLAAMEIFLQIRHTGVTLQDLLRLVKDSHHWNDPEPELPENKPSSVGNQSLVPSTNDSQQAVLKEPLGVSIRRNEDQGFDGSKKQEASEIKSIKSKEADGDNNGTVGDSTQPDTSQVETTKTREAMDEFVDDTPGEDVTDAAVLDDETGNRHVLGLKVDKDKANESKKENVDPKNGNESTSGEKTTTEDKGDPPLKEDPEYSKYFRMVKMGLPLDAVKHALKRDGKDPGIADLDPEKSLKSQMTVQPSKVDDGPALKDDPDYSKYFRMLKMGLPIGAVKNALLRDGKDPGIMDLDPEKSLKSQTETKKEEVDDGPPLKDDPEYSKYFKMLKMGLPVGAVKNALTRDGKDPGIMDLDPEKSLKSQTDSAEKEDDGPALKDDPEFSKYFRMLNMGLPPDAVKHALQRDGKDPTIMDLDHSRSLKSQTKTDLEDSGTPLKDDPEFSKYFKMLSMGLPKGAVQNALLRDGKDPAIMDLDPDKSVAFQLSKKGETRIKRKEKKRVRRKKIYWTPIDPGKVNEESIWSLVRGSVVMDQLKYDPKEFENLFTESSNPADKKKKAALASAGGASQAKKSVQVIDGKRGMNGGIILARVKMDYGKIAKMVDMMDSGDFDSTQLKAFKEFMPTDEERTALTGYLEKARGSEQKMNKAMADLSECEKYMVAIMKVDGAAAKFDCMLFRHQFKSRLDELMTAIGAVKTACDEVRTSEKLRKMMAMILTLVNQINTGGDGDLAVGFSLEALLKLNEAKAFDKKTSVLQYLVRLVKENDPSLLEFKHDIGSVPDAEGITLDSLFGDAKTLSDELTKIKETATKEAERLEEEGMLKQMSISDLSEQRTEIRQIDGLPHYNKVDHITGRTNMERFALRAVSMMESTDTSLVELKRTYSNLLEYFGEDEKMPSNEFFGTMKKFVLEFNKAAEYVEKLERAKLKEKMKAAAKKASTARRLAALAKTFSPAGKITKAASGEIQEGQKSIGEMAAKAVAKVRKKKESALATKEAAAARAHESEVDAKKGSSVDVDTDSIQKAPFAKSDNADTNEVPSIIGGGGIAATKTMMSGIVDDTGNVTVLAPDSNDSPSTLVRAGQASSRRNAVLDSSTGGGVLATAAIAAAVRASDSNSRQPMASPFAGGGIAAAAALAASKRLQSKVDKMDSRDEEGKTESESISKPPLVSPFAGGGIAAAAALAASKRLQSKGDKMDSRDEEGKTEPEVDSKRPLASPFAGGGIAAAAALAASQRNKSKGDKMDTRDEEGKTEPEVDSKRPLASPFAGGGIAAAAALAASQRNQIDYDRTDSMSEAVDDHGNIVMVGQTTRDSRLLSVSESGEASALVYANVQRVDESDQPSGVSSSISQANNEAKAEDVGTVARISDGLMETTAVVANEEMSASDDILQGDNEPTYTPSKVSNETVELDASEAGGTYSVVERNEGDGDNDSVILGAKRKKEKKKQRKKEAKKLNRKKEPVRTPNDVPSTGIAPSLDQSDAASTSQAPSEEASSNMDPSDRPSAVQDPSVAPSTSEAPGDGSSTSQALMKEPSSSVASSDASSTIQVPRVVPSISQAPSDGPNSGQASDSNDQPSMEILSDEDTVATSRKAKKEKKEKKKLKKAKKKAKKEEYPDSSFASLEEAASSTLEPEKEKEAEETISEGISATNELPLSPPMMQSGEVEIDATVVVSRSDDAPSPSAISPMLDKVEGIEPSFNVDPSDRPSAIHVAGEGSSTRQASIQELSSNVASSDGPSSSQASDSNDQPSMEILSDEDTVATRRKAKKEKKEKKKLKKAKKKAKKEEYPDSSFASFEEAASSTLEPEKEKDAEETISEAISAANELPVSPPMMQSGEVEIDATVVVSRSDDAPSPSVISPMLDKVDGESDKESVATRRKAKKEKKEKKKLKKKKSKREESTEVLDISESSVAPVDDSSATSLKAPITSGSSSDEATRTMFIPGITGKARCLENSPAVLSAHDDKDGGHSKADSPAGSPLEEKENEDTASKPPASLTLGSSAASSGAKPELEENEESREQVPGLDKSAPENADSNLDLQVLAPSSEVTEGMPKAVPSKETPPSKPNDEFLDGSTDHEDTTLSSSAERLSVDEFVKSSHAADALTQDTGKANDTPTKKQESDLDTTSTEEYNAPRYGSPSHKRRLFHGIKSRRRSDSADALLQADLTKERADDIDKNDVRLSASWDGDGHLSPGSSVGSPFSTGKKRVKKFFSHLSPRSPSWRKQQSPLPVEKVPAPPLLSSVDESLAGRKDIARLPKDDDEVSM